MPDVADGAAGAEPSNTKPAAGAVGLAEAAPPALTPAAAPAALPAGGGAASPAATSPAATPLTPAPSAPAASLAALAPLPATGLPASPVSAAVRAAPAGAQVAAALVQVVRGPAGSVLTLRLDPGALGHIQVRVERAPDGGALVHVGVERPETLQMLAADQTQLHRALDSAGLPRDGRDLQLALAPPAVTPAGGQDGGAGQPGGGAAPQTPGGAGGQPGGGGFGGNGQGGTRRQRAWPGAGGSGPAAASAWQRAGIDITA